jgi:hypothetical protein
MAKLKTEATTQPDLLEYLAGYSDFSFELTVLKMLREHEVACDHGGHYVDPVTNKSREFDIRATKTIDKYRVRMSVECKNIRENFPVLVSCVPRHEDESYHQVALVSERKRDSGMFNPAFIHHSRATVLDIRGPHSLYAAGDPVGKSTVQVGRAMDGSITANDSELYEKWGQCLSSLHGMAKDIYWDGDEDDPLDAYLSAAFPFVVVPNGRLWVASYDLDGRCVSDPTQVNRCSCFIGKDYKMGTELASARLWISHLEIVTFDGLRSFVESHLMTTDGMQRVFPQEGIVDAYKRATE